MDIQRSVRERAVQVYGGGEHGRLGHDDGGDDDKHSVKNHGFPYSRVCGSVFKWKPAAKPHRHDEGSGKYTRN
jgi:hypothetical protein